MTRVHATCVSVSGAGVLLRGPSGSGKSDLALRLVDAGAWLVADDQVALAAEDGRLVARAPAALAGLLEVRGVGILPVPAIERAEVAMIVDLVPPAMVERLPEDAADRLCGITVPLLRLAPFEVSAVAKLRLALAARLARIPTVPAAMDRVATPAETAP